MSVRHAFYRFKHRYPTPCIFTNIIDTQLDVETGERDIIQDAILIRKCCTPPESAHSKFFYDLAYVAANKNFTFGADYSTKKRTYLVDRRDVPIDFDIGLDTIIYSKSKQYRVSRVDNIDGERATDTVGYILEATTVEGSILPETITLRGDLEVTLSEVVP